MIVTVTINVYLIYMYLYCVDSAFTHYRYTHSNNAIRLGVNKILSDSKAR